MRDEIKNKMDEHVKEILSKPAISNEDYALLREKFAELPTKSNSGWDMIWLPMFLALAFGFGGAKE